MKTVNTLLRMKLLTAKNCASDWRFMKTPLFVCVKKAKYRFSASEDPSAMNGQLF